MQRIALKGFAVKFNTVAKSCRISFFVLKPTPDSINEIFVIHIIAGQTGKLSMQAKYLLNSNMIKAVTFGLYVHIISTLHTLHFSNAECTLIMIMNSTFKT